MKKIILLGLGLFGLIIYPQKFYAMKANNPISEPEVTFVQTKIEKLKKDINEISKNLKSLVDNKDSDLGEKAKIQIGMIKFGLLGSIAALVEKKDTKDEDYQIFLEGAKNGARAFLNKFKP